MFIRIILSYITISIARDLLQQYILKAKTPIPLPYRYYPTKEIKVSARYRGSIATLQPQGLDGIATVVDKTALLVIKGREDLSLLNAVSDEVSRYRTGINTTTLIEYYSVILLRATTTATIGLETLRGLRVLLALEASLLKDLLLEATVGSDDLTGVLASGLNTPGTAIGVDSRGVRGIATEVLEDINYTVGLLLYLRRINRGPLAIERRHYYGIVARA